MDERTCHIGSCTSGSLVRTRSFHWWGLAGVFLYLSVDEAISNVSFFLRLPRHIQNLFLVALGLFFGGAIGLEVLNDLYVYLNGGVRALSVVENVIRTLVFPHIEEFAEMSGLIVFIYALLIHARESFGAYEFRFEK